MRNLLLHRQGVVSPRQSGQIIVLFGVFLIVLLLLAGSAFDYASIVVDDAKLQNTVDAAALAGADTLSANAALPGQTPVSKAQTATVQYLNANHIDSTSSNIVITVLPYSPPAPTPIPATTIYDSLSLTVTRNHPTAFWPLAGINSVNITGSGVAHAARGMVDVMMALDVTGSEYQSGSLPNAANDTSQDWPIQEAVVQFVLQMRLQASDPRGARVGLARFAGLAGCTHNTAYDPPNYNCSQDAHLLSGLSTDAGQLIEIADPDDPNAAVSCPVGNPTTYACGLYWHTGSPSYYVGGTRLPNAIWVMGLDETTLTPNANYAWSTANAGRNNSPTGTGWAHKVMILMTDGKDEDSTGGSVSQAPTWDQKVKDMAAALKLGPDGIAGTQDDVEIYVINYACTPYDGGNCDSKLADTTSPHACPSASLPSPASMSNTDQLLINVSSSAANTCDHYFPLKKTESLPSLFSQLAGSISRGQLTQ
jgi:Flp pilus assembly protein TadG